MSWRILTLTLCIIEQVDYVLAELAGYAKLYDVHTGIQVFVVFYVTNFVS